MRKLQRYSMGAAVTALILEGGAKNLVMSAILAAGTPVTATGFVYEVIQMRHASLEREARDRVALGSASKFLPPASLTSSEPPDDPADATAAGPSLKHRIESMIVARSQYADIYGGTPEALTPIYQKVLRGMLASDASILGEAEAEKVRDPDLYERDLKPAISRLLALHAQLSALLLAQTQNGQSIAGTGPSGRS